MNSTEVKKLFPWQHLKESFQSPDPQEPPWEGYTPSAVLVLLDEQAHEPQVLYTLRTDRVRDHKKQVSFPGGVREKQDRNLEDTALRETFEETGLTPSSVELWGPLPPLYTPTGYHITPFVGRLLQPPHFQPNPHEIEEIFWVPLSHLLNPAHLSLDPAELYETRFAMPSFQYQRHLIWGATGRITLELIERIRQKVM